MLDHMFFIHLFCSCSYKATSYYLGFLKANIRIGVAAQEGNETTETLVEFGLLCEVYVGFGAFPVHSPNIGVQYTYYASSNIAIRLYR
jgi:hypothetical protein